MLIYFLFSLFSFLFSPYFFAGTPRKFAVEDHVCASYAVTSLTGNAFLLVYQDNEANTANVATSLLAVTHGGALRTGIATSAATIGNQVQVAVEGAATVPFGTIKVNGVEQSMIPGARYYATYEGGISPSSDDGVLLGRALRGSLLLLERDFAGGFRVDTDGAAESSAFAGEIKALAGATIPAGWLVCDGTPINRVDFSSLFAAIGTTWGVGDGTSTFNIPDLRGRTVIGVGKGGDGTTSTPSVSAAESTQAKGTQHDLGDYDGTETFSYAPATFSEPTANKYCIGYQSNSGYCKSTWAAAKATWSTYAVKEMGLFAGGDIVSENEVPQHNMMPYAALNYIIKT